MKSMPEISHVFQGLLNLLAVVQKGIEIVYMNFNLYCICYIWYFWGGVDHTDDAQITKTVSEIGSTRR